MLACSQRVNRKVGTGTIVIEQAGATHRHPIGLLAGRAHGIVAIKVPIRLSQDAHYTPVRPFAARGNLALDQHEEPPQYWGVRSIAGAR